MALIELIGLEYKSEADTGPTRNPLKSGKKSKFPRFSKIFGSCTILTLTINSHVKRFRSQT
ncbi:MAG: hypothetical protein CMB97_01775 [Flavobacteriaceae bacterium]|nr:hypothetical protein [Flavobacteriaceae bacterium]